ncbi:hypothetical protein [Streptomyces bohaiensis]|uniref:hypothetical protein n=1 Tax=Streptomyces bohaiensis TaxID=1431344 RepID=UPI003B7EE30F
MCSDLQSGAEGEAEALPVPTPADDEQAKPTAELVALSAELGRVVEAHLKELKSR